MDGFINNLVGTQQQWKIKYTSYAEIKTSYTRTVFWQFDYFMKYIPSDSVQGGDLLQTLLFAVDKGLYYWLFRWLLSPAKNVHSRGNQDLNQGRVDFLLCRRLREKPFEGPRNRGRKKRACHLPSTSPSALGGGTSGFRVPTLLSA